MKIDINKLKYYELLDFCIKHEDIEKKEKNQIIEKLLDYNICAITFDKEMLIPVSDIIFLVDNEFLDHRWVQ